MPVKKKRKTRRYSRKKSNRKSRRKKGKGALSSIRRMAQGKTVKGRIVGCDYFNPDKGVNGNYNALPYAVFLSAMLCRASYEYDALFMHLLVFIFNLTKTAEFLGTTLKNVNDYQALVSTTLKEPTFKARSMSDKYNPLALGKAIDKMKKRIAKPETFNNKSAQYYGTIYNTALEILGSRRKEVWKNRTDEGKKDRVTHWNKETHKNILGQIYDSLPTDDIQDDEQSNYGADNLNFVMIQNSHDLNLYVVYDKKSNTIVVVFRGTASMASAKDDLKPLLHSHTTGGKDEKDGMIHRGFGQQVNGSINRIINAMKYVYDKGKGAGQPKIFVCGHSLGGANSELFCYYYQKWISKISTIIDASYLNQPMTLVTWGAPRIGNMEFIKMYDEFLKNKKIILLRCTTDGDLIPTMPFEKMDYYHPGKTLTGEEGQSEYPHRYVCAHRLNAKSLQLSYSKPLYCGERKWCNAVPGMIAHSNAAYVSFGGIARTATMGSGLPSYTTYLRKNDYTGPIGAKLIKLKNYPKSDYISMELYKKEMHQDPASTAETILERYASEKESFGSDGTRLDDGSVFGTSIFGKGFMLTVSEAKKFGQNIKSKLSRKPTEVEAEVNKIEQEAKTSDIMLKKKIEGDKLLAHGDLEERLRERAAASAAGGGRRRTRRKKRTKKKARHKRRKSKRRR
jgi:hypothetical protein